MVWSKSGTNFWDSGRLFKDYTSRELDKPSLDPLDQEVVVYAGASATDAVVAVSADSQVSDVSTSLGCFITFKTSTVLNKIQSERKKKEGKPNFPSQKNTLQKIPLTPAPHYLIWLNHVFGLLYLF